MIRKATFDDLEQIVNIADDLPFKRDAEWFQGYLAAEFNVLEEDGIIVGFIIIKDDLLILIAVGQKHRGKGYGKELMKKALVEHPKIMLRVREPNKGAIEFYKKMGFKKTGVKKNYYKNGDTAIIMQV